MFDMIVAIGRALVEYQQAAQGNTLSA